ncbi:MAG: pyrroline-5-carboxylate reductase [Paracoccus denitrificans]|nr:MAG: pyrroline-5-carboxylate reductase [Paracoccus denitrificans]PZO82924.1 MAG: pyrroline-5-carboxylate reductase [Paracoccus denitrificans]
MSDLSELNTRGVVLVGAGHMGGAMLRGWLDRGVTPSSITVISPTARDWIKDAGVDVSGKMPKAPAVLVLAVKPQMVPTVLAELTIPAGTVVLSVAAGVTLATMAKAAPDHALIRAMPNLPAAIGQGITPIIGNDKATEDDLSLAETLLAAVGDVVRLQDEGQMDAVTAVSGSGPGYVFHMIEALATAAEAEGLPPDLALQLARATVAGAAAMAKQSEELPSTLRESVTSPGGTTQAGLAQLMNADDGLASLLTRAVHAAANRSRELGA